MDAELVSYLVMLVIGIALTTVVGTILRRSGQSLLAEVYPPPRAAGLTRLVTVGYFLTALGVLALISTVPVPFPVQGLIQVQITKLGVVLLILGIAYGLTLLVLNRMRDARRQAELDEEFEAAMRRRRP